MSLSSLSPSKGVFLSSLLLGSVDEKVVQGSGCFQGGPFPPESSGMSLFCSVKYFFFFATLRVCRIPVSSPGRGHDGRCLAGTLGVQTPTHPGNFTLRDRRFPPPSFAFFISPAFYFLLGPPPSFPPPPLSGCGTLFCHYVQSDNTALPMIFAPSSLPSRPSNLAPDCALFLDRRSSIVPGPFFLRTASPPGLFMFEPLQHDPA